jgi:hypothetical protein
VNISDMTTPHEIDITRTGVRVLVVGSDDWAIEQAGRGLQASGHAVSGCHAPGTPAFPCNRFLPGGRCPVEEGVDVVAVVRSRVAPELLPGELGTVCGLRAGVPVVAAGLVDGSPFAELASFTVAPGGDLAVACEAAGVIDLRPAASG